MNERRPLNPHRGFSSPRVWLLLVLLLATVGAGCGGQTGGIRPSLTAPGLEGTAWRGIQIGDVAPVVGAEPTIRFEAGQAGGTTGCNTYGGAYHLAPDGSFSIDSMVMTEMGCDGPRGKQERVVLSILGAADRLERSDGQLRISGPAGSITFVPADT